MNNRDEKIVPYDYLILHYQLLLSQKVLPVTEGVGLVLENYAFAQIERMASLFYSLKVGDNVYYQSLNV